MKIETKFTLGELVWDTLTKKHFTVIGLEIKTGKMCCSDKNEHYVRYYLDDHLCHTFRTENELEKDWQ